MPKVPRAILPRLVRWSPLPRHGEENERVRQAQTQGCRAKGKRCCRLERLAI